MLVRLALMMCAMVSPMFCQDTGQPESKAMPAPKLPFLDWKACPFEGCAYREWTARKAIAVYDTWEQKRRPVARLSPGDIVTGVTGVVITFKPGVIRMDRDLTEEKLKRGDTILTYTYRGGDSRRRGSTAGTIPSSTSRLRSGPTAAAAAVRIARPRMPIWGTRSGGLRSSSNPAPLGG